MGINCTASRYLRALSTALAVAALCGACAGGAAGPAPAPAAPAPPPAAPRPEIPRLTPTSPPAGLGELERSAWQLVVDLGERYGRGDAAGILSRVSTGFYHGYGQLERALESVFATTRSRGAVIAVKSVEAEEGRVRVTAEWTCSVTRRDGAVDAWYGRTVFILNGAAGALRLLDYRGDPPFALEGI